MIMHSIPAPAASPWTERACAEFLKGLPETELAQPIQALHLGLAAGLLRRHGIQRLDSLRVQLTAGLHRLPHFGPVRVAKVLTGVEAYARAGIGGTTPDAVSALPAADGSDLTFYRARHRSRMSAATLSLPLERIHLSLELVPLARLGVKNLGQLFTLLGKGIPLGEGMGKGRLERIYRMARCVDGAIDEAGEIDWQRFATLAGFTVYPLENPEPATDTEFFVGWSQSLAHLAEHHLDEVKSAILSSRFTPDAAQRTTQKALAERFGITVQRIGQREQSLLKILSGALLEENYGGLDYRFSAAFASRWRRLALPLQALQDRRYPNVLSAVMNSTHFPQINLAPLLPLLFAIATGDNGLPGDFFPAISFPHALASLPAGPDSALPIEMLHPSRLLAGSLRKSGLRSIGDFTRTAMRHALTVNPPQVKEAQGLLDTLAASITPADTIDWQDFLKARHISLIPAEETRSAEQFVAQVVPTLRLLIDRTRISPLAREIFAIRLVPDAKQRLDLRAAAIQLGQPAAKISKEQNQLTERLFDLIFQNDYRNSPVHLRDSFIDYWHEAYRICRAVSRPEEFVQALSAEWMIPAEDLVYAAPAIRAILRARPPRKLPARVPLLPALASAWPVNGF